MARRSRRPNYRGAICTKCQKKRGYGFLGVCAQCNVDEANPEGAARRKRARGYFASLNRKRKPKLKSELKMDREERRKLRTESIEDYAFLNLLI